MLGVFFSVRKIRILVDQRDADFFCLRCQSLMIGLSGNRSGKIFDDGNAGWTHVFGEPGTHPGSEIPDVKICLWNSRLVCTGLQNNEGVGSDMAVPVFSRVTVHSLTPGYRAAVVSISPGSTRNPRIFTCRSIRPLKTIWPCWVRRTGPGFKERSVLSGICHGYEPLLCQGGAV